METIIKSALRRALEEENPNLRLAARVSSGVIRKDVDYFQLAKEQFGVDVKKAKIVAVGVGGAGCNTITRLHELGVYGATTVALNTDAKHLAVTKADKRILIGRELTRGLGCGGIPEIGRKAAEESRNEIKEAIEGADMVFVLAGLGKGTGTGAAPVVAEIAKSMGALVIGVVEMPFSAEGSRRFKAEEGLARLREHADTVIVIENDRLLKYAGNLTLQQAFAVADELVANMIKGITETITLPSLINLDYADVRSVMSTGGGVAALGIAESSSSDRARDAVMKALQNPLIDVDYTGAAGALVHVTGGEDLKLEEVHQIMHYVYSQLDPSATVFVGARIMPEYEGRIQVITIVTGVKSPYILGRISTERALTRETSSLLGIEVFK
ncbi:MAG: cell division protein FtsZ [Candidatus Aenigmatarchaeota archaeon]|nr:cell division protein FtsZ [Candidatus Aenigmarchaeota archaeon]